MLDEIYDRGFIGRVLIFTLAYVVIGVLVPLQQGEPTITYILGTVVTGFLYGVLLGFVLTRMSVERIGRILSVWIAIFVVQMFNPILEGFFFSTLFEDPSLLVAGALFGAILTLVYSVIAGLLFVPKSATDSLGNELRSYFGERKVFSWTWRVVVAALSWLLFYFIFGSIVAPIVLPYYTDPSLGYDLVLPSVEIVLSLQASRGFIYIGALLPVVASLKIGIKRLLVVIIGFLYIGGGLAIFVIIETFPAILRIVHGLEIFADSLFFGIVITYLLGRKS